MSNAIENYQMEGEADNGKQANEWIADARKRTPVNLRSMFRSYIHFESGRYLFGWILR